MDTYPLFGSVRTSKWRQELLQNEKVKALFEKLSNEASREGIPLTSVTGHENVILTCAKLEHIDKRFGKGETLLHWAASYEPAYAIPSSKVLVLLLLGADPNIRDDLGRTPLHWAINHDCSDIAEDDELHYNRRSQANAVKVVYQLLHYKASPDVVDIYGASPFCHAVWSKCFDIADILRPLTSECFQKPPRFLLAENETMKSIRCSNVEQWIRQNTSNVTENEKRLQRLLSSPGIGLLQHPDEVEQQKEQVISLFKRLSCIIAKEDHLLEFVPTLAGSMAEGTKCQKPDEQDIILRLLKFEDVCIPEKSEFAPEGVITLKFTGNESKTTEYQKYILDGYLNREEILYSLITKLERELSLVSNWSGKECINIYPSHYPTAELKQAIDTGDIGNVRFVWHGQYYKQINLSIDIVPAIIIRDWKPNDATSIDPTGGAVPNETFLILRAFIETFEYDLEIHGE
ncbi:ankyrin repeat domain-containing protein 31-like [Ruditapes philippinarum]|uniref:ankyrin repeat domain-containing protein 31-like n=1 Tax=Ruditapes philippinarum TaxID=129788 RepID=UPI00295B548F|nr:ankyrin repeat domain-containing protein 31-like [Ruditapes philippinarum]